MTKNVYTVGQVNSYIKNMFAQDFMMNRIYVKGEVSNCKYHTSGHIYFTLKDETGAMPAVLFAGSRKGLAFTMKNGDNVIVLGSISVYERDGRYQLYAKEILLDGEGLLYQRFQQLKQELEEMGMFAPEYKQPIPKYIRTLGIVTAPTGASIRDIQNITSRRNPYVQTVLYPALVQGDGAAASIVNGIFGVCDCLCCLLGCFELLCCLSQHIAKALRFCLVICFFCGQNEPEKLTFAVRDDLEYSRFRELMKQADDLLGGGSKYAPDSLSQYGTVPLTYEEAKERYELALNSDQITGGYARLFSDYAGAMVLSVLPVFLAVILCMKDQRAKMEALIYTKKMSGVKLTLIRYAALVIAAMLPVVILSYLSNMVVWGSYSGMRLDYLAPLKYDLGWLMPSVMISTAIGMFLTELTDTPIAVAVQGLWWMFDINLGIKTVHSGYSLFRLAPRHNVGAKAWFKTQDYLDYFQNLMQNRFLMAGISLLLVIFTILIYEAKRKGKFGGNESIKRVFSNFRNRKNQSQA